VLRVRVGPAGSFAAGTLRSLRLVGAGLPVPDPAGAAGRLVSVLSAQDFGNAGVRVGAGGTLSAATLPPPD
jgi:hypothetical protein